MIDDVFFFFFFWSLLVACLVFVSTVKTRGCSFPQLGFPYSITFVGEVYRTLLAAVPKEVTHS